MPERPAFEFRLHGALWKGAPERKQREWRRTLGELNRPDSDPDRCIELVRPPGTHFQVRIYDPEGRLLEQIPLDAPELEDCLREYGATIRQLVHVDRSAPIKGVEALDYAKRVVHDDAASILRESLAAHADLSLGQARRLFTLLFLAHSDLPPELVRYHRFH